MPLDTFESAIERIVDFRDRRDWRQFHKPKDLAIALSIESAEALELFLWKESSEIGDRLAEQKFRSRLEEELGDILIYALLLCHETGINPEKAIVEKLRKNEHRYPIDLAKGSAKKYDELNS